MAAEIEPGSVIFSHCDDYKKEINGYDWLNLSVEDRMYWTIMDGPVVLESVEPNYLLGMEVLKVIE